MTPVTAASTPDPARKVTWVGETQVMSTVGALPIQFQIEAATLGEAAGKFALGQGGHRANGARVAGNAPPAGVLDRDSARRPSAGRVGRRWEDPADLSPALVVRAASAAWLASPRD